MSVLLLLMASALQAIAPQAPPLSGPPLSGPPLSGAPMPGPVAGPRRDAAVVLECGLQATGALSDCRVVSETPPGRGLGERALREASRTRYARPTVPPRPGEKVRFTTRYPWPAGVPDQD
jgi:hypothetical protein